MPTDLENEKTPIDPAKGEYRQMLENLQGDILKGRIPFLQRLATGE